MAREESNYKSNRHARKRSVESGSGSPPRHSFTRKRDDSPRSAKSYKHDRDAPVDYRRRDRSGERSHKSRHSYSRSRSPYRERRRHEGHSERHTELSKQREYTDDRRGRDSPRDRRSRKNSRSPSLEAKRSKKPLPSQQDAFNDETAVIKKSPSPEKQKPNFSNTGRLAAESNTVQSADGQAIVLKYHEPPEARKPAPKDAWRMYVFKGSDVVDTIELGQRSCWLFGREVVVADFATEHPSCSKQHAVIQFRYVEKKNEYGDRSGRVRPYIIDLESANGTEVNGERMLGGRYFELRDKDVIKFGQSSREYVIMLPPKE